MHLPGLDSTKANALSHFEVAVGLYCALNEIKRASIGKPEFAPLYTTLSTMLLSLLNEAIEEGIKSWGSSLPAKGDAR